MSPERIYLAMGALSGALWGGWAIAGISWWVVDLGLSPLRLVILATAVSLTTALAEAPTGAVADVFGRKPAIVASWALIGCATLLSPVSPNVAVLVIWQVIFAIGTALGSGADIAWVTDELGSVDDSLVVRHGVAISIGVLVGVPVAIIASAWSVAGTMSMFGVLTLTVAAWLWHSMVENHRTASGGQVGEWRSALRKTWSGGLGVVSGSAALVAISAAMVLVGAEADVVDRLDLVRLRELGLPGTDAAATTRVFGLIWMAIVVLGLPFQLWTTRFVDSRPSATPMLTCLMLLTAGLGLVGFTTPFLALGLVGITVRELSTNNLAALSAAWVNRIAPSDVRATVISFVNLAQGLGRSAGGLCLAGLAEVVSVRSAFVGAAGCMLAALVLVVPQAARAAATPREI